MGGQKQVSKSVGESPMLKGLLWLFYTAQPASEQWTRAVPLGIHPVGSEFR